MYFDQENNRTYENVKTYADANAIAETPVRPMQTIKDILEETGHILAEIKTEVFSISDAMYGKTDATNPDIPEGCMKDVLINHNQLAKDILTIVRGIREGMWK